jgi:hypothetical protein
MSLAKNIKSCANNLAPFGVPLTLDGAIIIHIPSFQIKSRQHQIDVDS